MLQSDNHTPGC